jgi:mono/diheme cytochrome c family protein
VRLAAALAALVLAAAPLRAQTADSVDRGADLKLGAELLQKNCASCHATGRTGASPNKDAPAFRTLGQRYPVDSLEEALGEGILSGHPEMPEFRFDADEVGAIIAYLQSIQQR